VNAPAGIFNPDRTPLISFSSLRDARSFVRGYCVPRVVARIPRVRRVPYVICHPDTARRHGWRVVS
jgi:hypothetical protein